MFDCGQTNADKNNSDIWRHTYATAERIENVNKLQNISKISKSCNLGSNLKRKMSVKDEQN